MNVLPLCPRCGGPLPDALAGLCPACLLKLAVGDSDGTAKATAPDISSRNAGAHPERIGPYRILEILGEGGMGIVYLAEQSGPIRRRVALKVIKPGMDTEHVLARFEVERQALAVMSHPHVAKVFDAGATEQGRPYFVMEYLPGIPITDYCDMRCLSISDRLNLFVQVCDAIQHAHQKGIIHRDIKPSNVLVATQDGSPVMKVIDFGVAKATGQALTDRTLFTQHGALVGTSEYMSPEQAGRLGLDVDARSDIYSLGVLLYELLVGARPFDPVSLRKAAVLEMERIIREEDPPKPATKFSTLGDRAPEVARNRQTDARSLARQLSGELEWVTMRALEKDPARRYASASEFAADLQRHLLNEPVLAAPAALSYRLKKLVRKHRVFAAAGAAVVAVLTAGVVVSTFLYVRAEAARHRAEVDAARNRLEAEAMQAALRGNADQYEALTEQAMALHRQSLGPRNPSLARHLVNYLFVHNALFPDHPPAGIDERQVEAMQLIETGLDAGDVTAVRTLLLLSEVVNETDETTMARLYAKAFKLVRSYPETGKEGAGELLGLLADLLDRQLPESLPAGQDELFEGPLREILSLRLKGGPPESTEVSRSRERLSILLSGKADRLQRDGDEARARTTYREALMLAAESGLATDSRIAEIESNLGRSLLSVGDAEEGESMIARSLGVLRATLGNESATTQQALNAVITSYLQRGNREQAEQYRRVLPAISVTKIRDLGTVTIVPSVRRLSGGFSASLSGRSVWALSDMLSGHQTRGQWLDSSWGVAKTAKDGSPTISNVDAIGAIARVPLLPLTSDEAAFNSSKQNAACSVDCGARWVVAPASLVRDEAGERVFVFYNKTLNRDGRHLGASIALWRNANSPAVRPVIRPDSAEPTLLFGADEPAWGSGALIVKDLLYAFACRCDGLSCPCLLARAPVKDALDRGAWQFYAAGSEWTADWRLSQQVLEAHPPMTIHWNAYLGKYVAVMAKHLSHRIRIATSDQPEGPWSEMLTVEGVAPSISFPWIGSALAHPDLTRERGRIEVLTYIRDVGLLKNEMRAVELEFSRK